MDYYKSWREVWDAIRRRSGIALIGAVLVAFSIFWKVVDWIGNVDFLLRFLESPRAQWIVKNGDFITTVVGFLLLLLVVYPRSRLSEDHVSLRERWRTWRYTSRGLSWGLYDRGEENKKAYATLRIESVSELPQPLTILILSVAKLEGIGPRFVADPGNPTIQVLSDIDVPYRRGRRVEFTLHSPKLHPPARLEVNLRSQGNAEIRVRQLLRNPGWRTIRQQ